MVWIVRRLELQRRYVPFVIVTNWISVVGLTVLSVPALLLLLGWATPSLSMLFAIGFGAVMVRLQWFATKVTLGVSGGVAACDRRARARPQPFDRGGAAGVRGLNHQ